MAFDLPITGPLNVPECASHYDEVGHPPDADPPMSGHRLHTQETPIGAETNCYVDVWIELLHAWGFEPLAALPFNRGPPTLKGTSGPFLQVFRCLTLRTLFGLDVQELAIWRPRSWGTSRSRWAWDVPVSRRARFLSSAGHRRGPPISKQHQKSTGRRRCDWTSRGRRLGYFHGQGYYEGWEADDFPSASSAWRPRARSSLSAPLRGIREASRGAAAESVESLVGIFALASLQTAVDASCRRTNPFVRFKGRDSPRDLELADVRHRSRYSTSTRSRRFASSVPATRAAATYPRLVADSRNAPDWTGRSPACRASPQGPRTLQFQLARAMSRQKPLNLNSLDDMGRDMAVDHGAVDDARPRRPR